MKIGCIIQARNTSTRLPGKVTLPLPMNSNTSVLEHVVKRVRKASNIDQVIVATTVNIDDNSICDIADALGVSYYRGSESHVLSRYYEAAKLHDLDIVIRITSDCPCIDFEVLEALVSLHLNEGNDYTSNTKLRTFPHGLDAEVFSFSVLEEAFNQAEEQFEIEHVTPYIYLTHKEKFKIGSLENSLQKGEDIRITLDTQADYMLLAAVFDYFKEQPDFLMADIIELFNKKPWLYLINSDIKQKKIYDSLAEEINDAKEILKKQELYNALKILEEHYD